MLATYGAIYTGEVLFAEVALCGIQLTCECDFLTCRMAPLATSLSFPHAYTCSFLD